MANSSSPYDRNGSMAQVMSNSGIDFQYPPVPTSSHPLDTTDPLQNIAAPTRPIYFNVGENDRRKNAVSIELTTTTPDSAAPHPYSNYPLPSSTLHRQNTYQRPHRSRARNRYPYAPFYERRHPKILHAPALAQYASSNYRQNRASSSKHNREQDDEEDHRPTRGFWVVLRLIFFVIAIESMESLEIALTVPLLASLHVDESYYSMAWLVSPIIGFLVQPVVGMWSDSCKCRWGKRRPFILAFAIGVYVGISLILNSQDLGSILGDPEPTDGIPIRAVLLIGVGVTLLDFCSDTANSPIRAYLIDTMNSEDQERGFILHAILGGIGGGLGFSAGIVKWSPIPLLKSDGGQFTIIYFIATFVCFTSAILTLTSVHEEPLVSPSSSNENGYQKNFNDRNLDSISKSPEIELDERRPLLSSDRQNSKAASLPRKAKRSKSNKYVDDLKEQEGFVEYDPATGERVPYDHAVQRTNNDVLFDAPETTHYTDSLQTLSHESTNSNTLQSQQFGNELQHTAKLVKLGFMRRSSSFDSDIDEEKSVTVKSMIISMIRMPSRLWKLMICQVIGAASYYATHLYFTEFMAVAVYNGTMEDEHDVERQKTYESGVEMGCWGLFVFALSAAVYAFCLERWLAERISLKLLYFAGFFIYVIACTVNYFLHNYAVNVAMCFSFGILAVSLKTIPFQMLAQFHTDETYRNRDGSRRGIGIDCSLLNSCIFLGELIIAASLSPVVKATGVNSCMLVAAGFGFFGNICILFFLYLLN